MVENATFIALSKQMALRSKMDIVANNVANTDTPGFMTQNMQFREYVEQPKGQEDPMSFIWDYQQFHSTEKGPIKQTGNTFDIALQGPGFFGVQGADGPLYTRAGDFNVNAQGTLVTPEGRPVMSQGGGQIQIPADAGNVTITEDGTISTDDGAIGQLMVQEFDNIQSLKPRGDNLYTTDAEGQAAQNTRVLQGKLEGSNVSSVKQMSKMIEVSRSYQSVKSMISDEHDRQQRMIRTLTRSS